MKMIFRIVIKNGLMFVETIYLHNNKRKLLVKRLERKKVEK